MKSLILAGKAPDTQSLSSGWFNALSPYGKVEGWFGNGECAFDCFDRFQPDLIWMHSRDLTREFVRAAIDSQQKIILFLSDAAHASDREKNLVSQLQKSGVTTAFSTCFPHLEPVQNSRWNEISGVMVLSCLPAADLTRHFPVPANLDYYSQISYIACYQESRLKNLQNFVFPLLQDFDLKIFGYGNWPTANYLGSLNKDIFNTVVCSSRINLSVSTEDEMSPSERIFKILACGKLPLIHKSSEAYPQLFHWGYFYQNQNELFERVKFILSSPIEDGECPMKFIADNHTYSHRVKQVFETLEIK